VTGPSRRCYAAPVPCPTAISRACAALAAALALAGSACGNAPSASDCDKAVRHIIDLEAAEAGAGALPPDQRAELDQRKQAVFKSVGTSYCRDEMSVEQVRCALEAKSLAELAEKCDAT
jgi:hypothetical protein